MVTVTCKSSYFHVCTAWKKIRRLLLWQPPLSEASRTVATSTWLSNAKRQTAMVTQKQLCRWPMRCAMSWANHAKRSTSEQGMDKLLIVTLANCRLLRYNEHALITGKNPYPPLRYGEDPRVACSLEIDKSIITTSPLSWKKLRKVTQQRNIPNMPVCERWLYAWWRHQVSTSRCSESVED